MLFVLFGIILLCLQTHYIQKTINKKTKPVLAPASKSLSFDLINTKTELINKMEQTTSMWLLDNGIIKHIEKRYVLQEPADKQTDFSKRVYITNFKSFSSIEDVDEFYKNMPSSFDIDFIELSEQLISLLTMLYGFDAIHFLKARTYNTLQIVVPENSLLWKDTDKEYPNFWIFIYMQRILLQLNTQIVLE